MSVTIQDLKMQIGQMANTVSHLQSARFDNLPSQTILNLRGSRSRPTDADSKPDVDSQVPQQDKFVPLSFPIQTLLARKPESDEELLKMFRKVEINIPLLDAIKHIPSMQNSLRSCAYTRGKIKGGVELGGIVLVLTKNNNIIIRAQQALPKKCQDPEIFFVPCTIADCTFVDAVLEIGASINVMPASIYKSLNFRDLEPIGMTIQLANRSVVGIIEDVLVQVNELIFPTDFYVLDMEDETSGKGSTLILWRPFLMIARTKIDVHVGTLSMEFGDNLVQFNIFEAMKHPIEDHSLFGIDLIDELVEEHLQLGTNGDDTPIFVGDIDIFDCL
ncbi:hypothetical protein CR513_13473, partial [Mucuna pruriens]